LVARKPIHSALSVTLYAELKKISRPPESYRIAVAAFGDPVYSAAGDSAGSVRSALSLLTGGSTPRPLPHSRNEVEQIARLYPDKRGVYLGGDATEEQVKNIGTDVRILHFAVHAFLDQRYPLNSALALTIPSASVGRENGLLQAWELYQNVRWDADLVVLSACETGIGQEFGGEGLMSLTRAIHYAGARSVLSSLWEVDDGQTTQLMTAIHRHMRDGKPKDAALRAAQLELLQTRPGSAPFFWAAFTLQGDWR
jgi:CHAT domain-containing protein